MTAPLTDDRFREIQALEPADRTPQEIGTATLDLVREIHRLRHCVKTADRGHRASLAGTCTMLGVPEDTAEPDAFEAIRRLRAELEQAREARLEWSRIGDHPELANWADSLVSADLTPHPAFAWNGTTTGYEVAAQVAITDQLTDTARDQLLAELRAAFTETVCRVLDRSPAHPACTCGARPVHQNGCGADQDN